MLWTALYLLVVLLGLASWATRRRHREREALAKVRDERREAKTRGSHDARLQYPHIDLNLCIGCGACVRACPEHGVLGLAHGQAVVIHGARCVGHGLCAEVCPTGGIQVKLGDLETRDDIPALADSFEVVGVPGLYLAGEVTGYALVRTAITQGTAVARHVARVLANQLQPVASRSSGRLAVAERSNDLLIVGAGPAGLACALAAKEAGVDARIIEQESLGGTVAKYPRRKLVMLQPVDLPLYGRLAKTTYLKEELMELWQRIADAHELAIETGVEFTDLRRVPGGFEVVTKTGSYRAAHVCLCLGRRGTPRTLGVPGEGLPKVVYALVDAAAYTDRKILVVGGGDSAIEAAYALAEQSGNRVTLSYRKAAFTRLKAQNEQRITEAIQRGTIRVLFESQVTEIAPDFVRLDLAAQRQRAKLQNDDVFIFAGGIPPFALLRKAGISFDPELRAPEEDTGPRGTGLRKALQFAFRLSLGAVAWFLLCYSYYQLPGPLRPDHRWHEYLRPTGWVGMSCGVLATILMLTNLAYLLRRSRLGVLIAGSIRYWLSLHMVTGILALLFLFVHAGMVTKLNAGGMAFGGVVILVLSGGIGRYLYAWLPKAANGSELKIEAAWSRLASLRSQWDQVKRSAGEGLEHELDKLLAESAGEFSLGARIRFFLFARMRRRRLFRRLGRVAKREGLAKSQLDEVVSSATELHEASIAAHNLEDLRGILASWRVVHLWVAIAMVVFAVVHIYTALRFSSIG